MIRELFKDISSYLPAVIVPIIIGIIALPVITRLFHPSDYGNYIIVMATIAILCAIVGWLRTSIIRFYPSCERDGQLPKLYGTVINWLIISIVALDLIFLGILFAVKTYLSIQLYHFMLVGTLVFISSAGFEVLQSFLRAKRQVSLYVAFSIWKSVATLIIGIVLVISLNFGVEGLLWGSVLATAVAFPLLGKTSLKKVSSRAKGFSPELTKEMAKYSFPLVVGNLAAWIMNLSDRYFLEFFRDANEVGIYSISYRISENSIMLFTSLFAFAFNPLCIIIWEKEGYKQSQEFLTKGTRYFLLLCIPSVVGISLLREPILRILSTPNYYEGAKIMPFIALGVFFLGLNQRFGAGLSFYKKTHFFMFSLIIASGINIGLNFLFIQKYGYMAAAVTTLVSYGVLLLLTIIFSRRFYTWQFPFKSLINSICASAIMGIGIYFIGGKLTSSNLINLTLSVCLGGFIYFTLLFLLQEIQPKEKKAVKRVLENFLYRRS